MEYTTIVSTSVSDDFVKNTVNINSVELNSPSCYFNYLN